MPKRIGVFVDVSNLYYCISQKYGGRKLSYQAYLDFLEPLGEVSKCVAYGSQLDREANSFIGRITRLGFLAKYRKPRIYQSEGKVTRKCDWDVGMSVDMMDQVNNLDMIVLGSADGDMAPCINWLQDRDVSCMILACNISIELKKAANKFIEIPESLLERHR